MDFIEDCTLAVMLVAQASGAEPEEVLEALPRVLKLLEERYRSLQPGYVGHVQT